MSGRKFYKGVKIKTCITDENIKNASFLIPVGYETILLPGN